MKTTDAALIALLRSGSALIADIFEFTLVDGAKDYFSGLDIPVVWNGNTYRADSLRIQGLRLRVAIGTQVDEQEVVIMAYPTDKLAGSDFLAGAAQGLLDGAYITKSRAIWTPTTGIPAIDFAATPAGVIPLFTGRVSTVSKIGRTQVTCMVKSPLVLLSMDVPRNSYDPACLWVLYSSGCGIARASFTNNFVVSSTTPTTIFLGSSSVSPVTGADGLPYYAQGRLVFLSGNLKDLEVSIKTNDATSFTLIYPLIEQPDPGSLFAASAGCSKTDNTCTLKFSNHDNFRGFPRVPPMNISI